MLNQVTMQGRLTREPELKTSTNGKPIALFSIACTRDYNREETDFFDVVAWGKTAEFVSRWFHKGQLVAVSGRLQNRLWTDKSGNKRTSTEIVLDAGYFCEAKPKNAGEPQEDAQQERQGAPDEFAKFEELADDDGDLPF